MSHAGMTCKQLVELTTEYFEGTLFPPDRVRFQAHLKTCAHCASYVEQMCQTIKALGRLPGGTVAGHVMEALLRTFRRWQQDPRTVDFFQLGTSSDEVPPGSHMVHCYATDQQRDDFARRYMDAGLRAGESCVILGDPAFVDYTAQLLRAAEPADGWSGRLFVAPWDRSPRLTPFNSSSSFTAGSTNTGRADCCLRLRCAAKGVPQRRASGHWATSGTGRAPSVAAAARFRSVPRSKRRIKGAPGSSSASGRLLTDRPPSGGARLPYTRIWSMEPASPSPVRCWSGTCRTAWQVSRNSWRRYKQT